MAFFDTQNIHGIQTVRHNLMRLAGFEQSHPDRLAMIRRHIYLISQFTGKTDAQYPHRHAVDAGLQHPHKRQRGITDIAGID